MQTQTQLADRRVRICIGRKILNGQLEQVGSTEAWCLTVGVSEAGLRRSAIDHSRIKVSHHYGILRWGSGGLSYSMLFENFHLSTLNSKLSLLHRLAKRLGNDALGLMEQTINASICALLTRNGLEWLVDGELQAVRVHDLGILLQDGVWAFDGDRHYRDLEHGSQRIGTLLEGIEVTVLGAGTLRENDERVSGLEGSHGLTDGMHHARRTMRIDKDMTSALAGRTNGEDIAQTLAEHPAEVVTQITKEQEDIESTLMIGYKYVWGLGIDILASLHADRTKRQIDDQAGPDDPRPVPPELLVAQPAPEYGNNRSNDGNYDHAWHKDKPLIDEIENLHIL